MKAVKARKDRIIGKSRTGVETWVRGMKGCTVYFGHARFTGPRQVSVNGETLTADKIFINVGGRADRAADSRHRYGAVSHQHVDDGCGFSARASHRARRQLYRP